MKKINQKLIAQTLVPLPPFNEQQRIAARIEELFTLVDMISNGKELKIEACEIKLKDNMNVTEIKPHLEVQKCIDVSSFGLVAREDGEVTQVDLDNALSEVQDFYDKNKN